MLAAVRGAVAFLTRLPVGFDEDAWRAFAATPATIPLVGYLVGAVVALPLLAAAAVPALPPVSVALAYLVVLSLLTGITHVDGVADLADAAVVHGDADRRREVMTDSVVGTGGALAVAITVLGLGAGAVALVPLVAESWRAVGIAIAAEVGAKAGMALLVCLGTPAFEGMGAALCERADAATAVPVALVAAPAAVLTWPVLPAATAALLTAPAVAALVYAGARRLIGGLNGDVLGAANELGRVAALHAGVIAWTLS